MTAPETEFSPALAVGAEVFRRRIRVRAVDAATTRCELQDDFHHFVVTLRHDGNAVVDLEADSRRWPWATCPDAATPLRALVGMPLADRFTAASRWADASQNCTHQFDAAAHAITHTVGHRDGSRDAVREYECEIGATLARSADGPGRNRLWVDRVLTHDWLIQAGRGPVELPAPLQDAPWKGGFMRWADEHLAPEVAEHAIVLRRACDIGMGRGMDLDAIPQADELLNIMSGVCYTMQPTIAIGSRRNVGNIRDFANAPELLAET